MNTTPHVESGQLKKPELQHTEKFSGVLAKDIHGSIFDGGMLRGKVQEIERENPSISKMLERIKTASEPNASGVERTLGGQARGHLMELIVAKGFEPHVETLAKHTKADTLGGKFTFRDLDATAKERLIFSRRDIVEPGERFSVEIKAGKENYLTRELKQGGHVEQQIAGHDGKRIIMVSKDFESMPLHLQKEYRSRFREQNAVIFTGLPRVSHIDKQLSNWN